MSLFVMTYQTKNIFYNWKNFRNEKKVTDIICGPKSLAILLHVPLQKVSQPLKNSNAYIYQEMFIGLVLLVSSQNLEMLQIFIHYGILLGKKLSDLSCRNNFHNSFIRNILLFIIFS